MSGFINGNYQLPPRCCEEVQEMLMDMYLLMDIFLSGGGTLDINRDIRKKMEILARKYNLSKNDVLHSIFTDFISGDYWKVHPGKTRTTFAAHYTHNKLCNLLRKYQGLEKNVPISVDAYPNTEAHQDRIGMSMPYWEKRGLPALSNQITPEDELIGKELFRMILEHFGAFDAEVATGLLDRLAAAEELSITYNGYCKHFRRQLDKFMPVLAEAGYLS